MKKQKGKANSQNIESEGTESRTIKQPRFICMCERCGRVYLNDQGEIQVPSRCDRCGACIFCEN